MISKLIIHLKNIIFFKSVICLITIIILVSLVPIFSRNLEDVAKKNEKSYLLLQKSKSRLASLKDFGTQMPNIRQDYEFLIARAKNGNCLDRTKLINQVNALNDKYSLSEPIFVRISRIFNDKTVDNYSYNVKVNSYEMRIAFNSRDYNTMLMICKELYEMLPYGSAVTSTVVERNKTLTPDIVNRLNTESSPGFLKIKMIIQLREIVYEK
jgi:hypothetical protein